LIFTETSKEASAKLSAQVECSGWGAWEANGGLKTAMDTYSKNSKLKITYHQTGGKSDEIATDPDEFLKVIKNLPKLAGDAPVYTKIGLTRYDSLPNWPIEPMEGEVTPYNALLRRYFEYLSLYDDIAYIRGNKSEFLLGRGATEKSLKDTQDELLTGMNAIKNILPKCAEKGGIACDVPEEAKKPDYDFRIRMPIMLNYTPETNIFTSENALREQISNKWIEDVSDERHKIGQEGLANKQIDAYKSQIEVTEPPQAIYLQHIFTRKYLGRFDRKSSSYIEAGKGAPDVFCEFSVEVLSPNKIALRANNGKYLGRVNRKNPLDHNHHINSIEPVKTTPSVYGEFGVTFLANEKVSDKVAYKVAFMADNGKYLRSIGTNWPVIEASGDRIDERCEFLVIDRRLSQKID
jgi:hypothetical protein